MEYPVIAITSKSTLTLNDSTSLNLIGLFNHLTVSKQMNDI